MQKLKAAGRRLKYQLAARSYHVRFTACNLDFSTPHHPLHSVHSSGGVRITSGVPRHIEKHRQPTGRWRYVHEPPFPHSFMYRRTRYATYEIYSTFKEAPLETSQLLTLPSPYRYPPRPLAMYITGMAGSALQLPILSDFSRIFNIFKVTSQQNSIEPNNVKNAKTVMGSLSQLATSLTWTRPPEVQQYLRKQH